jgi:hypothetical protein
MAQVPEYTGRYISPVGKFTMLPPEGFDIINPIEETGKENATLVQFGANKMGQAFVKAIIYRYENTKVDNLAHWAESGRTEWMFQSGYKEEVFTKVKFKEGDAYVHVFTFYNVDQNGKPRNRFKMKSIRYMRGRTGYWFVFYATPKFYDQYCERWEQALKTIKFDDEKAKN